MVDYFLIHYQLAMLLLKMLICISYTIISCVLRQTPYCWKKSYQERLMPDMQAYSQLLQRKHIADLREEKIRNNKNLRVQKEAEENVDGSVRMSHKETDSEIARMNLLTSGYQNRKSIKSLIKISRGELQHCYQSM